MTSQPKIACRLIPEGNYKLISSDSSQFSLSFDSVRVHILEDKLNPFVKIFHPDKYSQFKDSLEMYIQFSEPLDTSAINKETFYLLDLDSNLIFPSFTFPNQSLCLFSNDFLTKDMYQYQLYISEFDIVDLSGNRMGDSTTKQTILIINPDSLGTVTGTIKSIENMNNFDSYLQLRNLVTQQLFTFYTSEANFHIEVPQGQYFINGYADINKNQKRDFGNIKPLEFAEPFFQSTDTLKIRARFETTNVILEFK